MCVEQDDLQIHSVPIVIFLIVFEAHMNILIMKVKILFLNMQKIVKVSKPHAKNMC